MQSKEKRWENCWQLLSAAFFVAPHEAVKRAEDDGKENRVAVVALLILFAVASYKLLFFDCETLIQSKDFDEDDTGQLLSFVSWLSVIVSVGTIHCDFSSQKPQKLFIDLRFSSDNYLMTRCCGSKLCSKEISECGSIVTERRRPRIVLHKEFDSKISYAQMFSGELSERNGRRTPLINCWFEILLPNNNREWIKKWFTVFLTWLQSPSLPKVSPKKQFLNALILWTV